MVLLAGTYNGTPWREAAALVQLLTEADALAPNRERASDGTIGDAVHQAQGVPTFDPATGYATGGTDHLPDSYGYVCALDLTHDHAGGLDAIVIAERILARVRAGLETRLGYIELENVVRPGERWEGSRSTGWVLAYVGPSSAAPHGHFSVRHGPGSYTNSDPWQIAPAPTPAPAPAPTLTRRAHPMIFFTIPDGPGIDPHVVWMTDGFTRRGMHNPTELQTWQYLAIATGQPAASVHVAPLPWAAAQHLAASTA